MALIFTTNRLPTFGLSSLFATVGFCSFFTVSVCFAQETGKEKTKSTVIDFSKDGKTVTKTTTEESSNTIALPRKNAIWIEAVSVFQGYVDISYERAFNKNLSVEVGYGITFNSIFERSTDAVLFSLFKPIVTYDGIEYWDAKGYTLNRTTGLSAISVDNALGASNSGVKLLYGQNYVQRTGTYLLLEPKFFPDGDVFEGFFLAPRIQYQKLNITGDMPDIALSNSMNSGELLYSSKAKIDSYRDNLDLIAHLGWQREVGRAVFAFEFGVGARFAHTSTYDVGQRMTTDPVTGGITYDYLMRNNVEERATLPMFDLAFKVGIDF